MRTFTNEELKVILEKHLKYRKNEDGGERANLRGSDLSYSDLDFSYLSFSCKSLSAKFDQKHVIQILYHAAMPTQNDVLELDDDIKDLLNSDLFKAVANKFHRVEECGEFKGCKSEARRRGRLI